MEFKIKQIKEIVDGTFNLIVKSRPTEDLYNYRKSVCDTCLRFRNGRCLECGCIIAMKGRSPESTCPLSKWEK